MIARLFSARIRFALTPVSDSIGRAREPLRSYVIGVGFFFFFFSLSPQQGTDENTPCLSSRALPEDEAMSYLTVMDHRREAHAGAPDGSGLSNPYPAHHSNWLIPDRFVED